MSMSPNAEPSNDVPDGLKGDEYEAREEATANASMRAAILSVAICAGLLSAGAFAGFGVKSGAGVVIGGAIATANLWVFSRIGQAFIGRRGNTAPWALIAVLKLAALLFGVWMILKSGLVSGLSLTVGYGALPIGITLGSLFGPKPPEPKDFGSSGTGRAKDVLEAGRAHSRTEDGAKGAGPDHPSSENP